MRNVDPVEQRARRPLPLTRKEIEAIARCWHQGAELGPLLGAWENFVFAIRGDAGDAVLRLVEEAKRSLEEVKAELEFLAHVRDSGVPVPEVLTFSDGRQIRRTTISGVSFLSCIFGRVAGRAVTGKTVLATKRGVHDWGVLIASVHNASNGFAPTCGRRSAWHESGLLRDQVATDVLNRDARAALDAVIAELASGRPARNDYGLIHADLHGRNVLTASGVTTVIDFDDLCYHWYAYDLAVACNWLCDSGAEAHRCAGELIEGYAARRTLGTFGGSRLFKLGFLRSCLDRIFIEQRIRAGIGSRLLLLQAKMIDARVARQLQLLH